MQPICFPREMHLDVKYKWETATFRFLVLICFFHFPLASGGIKFVAVAVSIKLGPKYPTAANCCSAESSIYQQSPEFFQYVLLLQTLNTPHRTIQPFSVQEKRKPMQLVHPVCKPINTPWVWKKFDAFDGRERKERCVLGAGERKQRLKRGREEWLLFLWHFYLYSSKNEPKGS